MRDVLKGQSSRTAEYVALFRALETQRQPERRVFADPLAGAFLTGPLAALAALARVPGIGALVPLAIDRRVPGPRPSAVARTKVLDEAVEAALSAGTEQLVILGAGYDSRAYRLAGAGRVQVFEVDHPDTQVVKRRVVANTLGGLPAHVRFVPVDFDHDDLAAALDRAGLVPGRRTFILWEGVLSYLTPDAVDATVRWAARIAGPGSELGLTYVHRGLIDGTVRFPHAGPWVASVAAAGEPFVFGFDPVELPRYLADRGWQLVDDLSTTEALTRHGLNPHRVPAFYRIALARAASR
jgi:methyltransferase (TIGR00027 family)